MGNRKKLLTETELELMTLLWKLGEGSVSDVQSALPPHRKLAYTSVSTMLRILEQKDFVASRKTSRPGGRGHVYFPKVAKEAYEETSARDLVERVFEGDASSLVRHLIERGDLSRADLNEIRELLEHAPKGESR